MILLKSINYAEIVKELKKKVEIELYDREVLKSVFSELITDKLIFEKLKLTTVDLIDEYENKLKGHFELDNAPISGHINAFNQCTGQKIFDYIFDIEKINEENCNVILEYSLKETGTEDPYSFVMEELVNDFASVVNTEEIVQSVVKSIINSIFGNIKETIAYSEKLAEELVGDKISMEDFEKRLQFRIAGVHALKVYNDNN